MDGPRRAASCASAWAAAFVLAALCVGCGGGIATVPVAGVVQFDADHPVRTGTVEFRERQSGRIARGALDQKGHFALGTFGAADGAVPGNYQVIVVQHFLPDQLLSLPEAGASGHADESIHSDHAEHDEHLGQPLLVHPKFADYATSPLTAIVRADAANNVALVVEGVSPGSGPRGVHNVRP